MKKKNNKVFIFTILILMLILSIVFIYHYFIREKSDLPVGNKNNNDVISQIEADENIASSEVEVQKELRDNPINFKKLQKKNEDLYAWIKVPNTNIDYAIAQHPYDHSFYLSHDNNKNYLFAGSIYTERLNKKDFSDPNTVIYGHNMLDGSMFATLHNFQDEKFFNKNKYFYIYTPGHILTYEIFAAYEYDNRHLLNTIRFKDKKVYAEYLESIKIPHSFIRNFRDSTKVTADDKIVTLSTCIGNKENSRYLVQGVLINDEITK